MKIVSLLTFIANVLYTLFLIIIVLLLGLIKIIIQCTIKIAYYSKKIIKIFFSNSRINEQIIEVPLEFLYTVKHSHGFYTSVFLVNKQVQQISTFFPSEWSKEKVMEAISEAYDDFQSRNENIIPNKDGIYIVHGFTRENIKIELYINHNEDEFIVDYAYPLFE